MAFGLEGRAFIRRGYYYTQIFRTSKNGFETSFDSIIE